MARFLGAAALLALLAACDGQQPLNFGETSTQEPVVDDNGDPIEFLDNGIPASVGGNLDTVSYNAGTGVLQVQIRSLDSTPTLATYERNAALDVPGYIAYSQQEDPLDRFFIAMVQQTNDGGAQGVLVMDGGQFTKYFGGVNYQRLTSYTPHTPSQPDDGLVSYHGDYVGMLNFDANRPNEALPVSGGVAPSFIPGQAARVTGEVFVNADFTDMTVNGGIANRVIIDPNALGLTNIDDVFLIPTDIAADGTFVGTMENVTQDGVGSYAGTFGGNGATGIVTGVRMDGDFILSVDEEEEYGLFVLNKCGTAGEGALCSEVNP